MANVKNNAVAMAVANNAGIKVLDGASLDKTGKSLLRRATTLGADIHKHLLNLLAHCQQHGDVTKVCAFVNAMPASQRKQTMIGWVMTYSPVNVNGGNMFTPDNIKYRAWDLASAAAKPYYDKQEAKVDAPFDFEVIASKFESIIKSIDKALTSGTVPANEVEPVKALRGQLVGFKARNAILNDPDNAKAALLAAA